MFRAMLDLYVCVYVCVYVLGLHVHVPSLYPKHMQYILGHIFVFHCVLKTSLHSVPFVSIIKLEMGGLQASFLVSVNICFVCLSV